MQPNKEILEAYEKIMTEEPVIQPEINEEDTRTSDLLDELLNLNAASKILSQALFKHGIDKTEIEQLNLIENWYRVENFLTADEKKLKHQ